MRGDKSKHLNIGSRSGASGLVNQTRTYLNGAIKAKRVVIAHADIEAKTGIHPLNPRNQDALTLESVSDIYSSIKENGVNVEGVAIKNPTSGKYELLDASRRRFTCIHAGSDLPFWELLGDVSDEQILAIINDSQEVKRWSYPEHASYLLTVAERKGIDVGNAKIEDLAAALGMGRESLRKRLMAHNVSLELRKVFVDYEGIPNAYYADLAKLQRDLEKSNKDIRSEMLAFKVQLEDKPLDGELVDKQKATLDLLKEFVAKAVNQKSKPQWDTQLLAKFDDKKAYARASKSPDGKSMKYEFSRVGADSMKKIDAYIRAVLEGKA